MKLKRARKNNFSSSPIFVKIDQHQISPIRSLRNSNLCVKSGAFASGALRPCALHSAGYRAVRVHIENFLKTLLIKSAAPLFEVKVNVENWLANAAFSLEKWSKSPATSSFFDFSGASWIVNASVNVRVLNNRPRITSRGLPVESGSEESPADMAALMVYCRRKLPIVRKQFECLTAAIKVH